MDDLTYNELPGERFSLLSAMSVSALEYVRQEHHDSPALLVGRALHCTVLEPSAYEERFAFKPDGMSFATKDGKAWRDKHAGREILDAKQAERVEHMRDALLANPDFAALLGDAEAIEMPLQWTDTASGIACKAKPDLVTRHRQIVEIKTTRLRQLRQLHTEIGRRLYHCQLGYYSTPLDVTEHLIAFVQNVLPWDTVVMRVPLVAIEAGRAIVARWLSELAECRRSGRWPGLSRGIIDAEVPDWAMGDAVELDMEGLSDGQ